VASLSAVVFFLFSKSSNPLWNTLRSFHGAGNHLLEVGSWNLEVGVALLLVFQSNPLWNTLRSFHGIDNQINLFKTFSASPRPQREEKSPHTHVTCPSNSQFSILNSQSPINSLYLQSEPITIDNTEKFKCLTMCL
jgi:hypothetical protein